MSTWSKDVLDDVRKTSFRAKLDPDHEDESALLVQRSMEKFVRDVQARHPDITIDPDDLGVFREDTYAGGPMVTIVWLPVRNEIELTGGPCDGGRVRSPARPFQTLYARYQPNGGLIAYGKESGLVDGTEVTLTPTGWSEERRVLLYGDTPSSQPCDPRNEMSE